MKNLLYKEFKLAMHPVCYLFTFLFPLMILTPNNPSFTGTIYCIPIMAVLFLGANKGKQSNDLFYSVLLPIRKKDIVKARMASVMFMELCTLIMIGLLSPIKMLIANSLAGQPGTEIMNMPGFSIQTLMTTIAFTLIGYGMCNAFFFLMFYKSGRSVTAPTLCATFAYVIYIMVFTMALNFLPGGGYALFYTGFNKIGIQVVYLFVGLLIYLVSNYFIYKKASKELEKVDL